MLARNVTPNDLSAALNAVNRVFDGNVGFNRCPDRVGRGYRFTLRVADSKGPGHRRTHTGRRHPSACWHVHGLFFEALFAINPNAIIVSRWVENGRITKDNGNWQDHNIGSVYRPLQFSSACDCRGKVAVLRHACPACRGIGTTCNDSTPCWDCDAFGFITRFRKKRRGEALNVTTRTA